VGAGGGADHFRRGEIDALAEAGRDELRLHVKEISRVTTPTAQEKAPGRFRRGRRDLTDTVHGERKTLSPPSQSTSKQAQCRITYQCESQ
jgi:hypothetical protein